MKLHAPQKVSVKELLDYFKDDPNFPSRESIEKLEAMELICLEPSARQAFSVKTEFSLTGEVDHEKLFIVIAATLVDVNGNPVTDASELLDASSNDVKILSTLFWKSLEFFSSEKKK